MNISDSYSILVALPALASPTNIIRDASGPAYSNAGLVGIKGNAAFQGYAVNANGGIFVMGKPSTTYDAEPFPGSPSLRNITAVNYYNTTGTVYLDGIVPGGQQVYVSEDSALSFTLPHQGDTYNGTVTGFSVDEGQLKWSGLDWQACDQADGSWTVASAKPGLLTGGCVDFEILVVTNPDIDTETAFE